MGLFKDITRASNYVAATTTEGIALVQAKTPWIGAAIAKAIHLTGDLCRGNTWLFQGVQRNV